jgi:hypothetical protein
MPIATNRTDRLYDLLPAVIRIRDYDQGEPLRALLQVIAGQVNVVEDDIARLYDNWFIETCEDWVVPYIGDLLGHSPVHEAGEPGDVVSAQASARNRILVPRREVAHVIRSRRRKGTLALLELLARDVAGWPARAVEFRKRLAHTFSVRTCLSGRHRTVDVREMRELARVGDPFDGLARVPDLRRINSARRRGRYNVPAVGLHVWRLRAYSITHAPAYCVDDVGPHSYTFSVLGNDAPLFNRPIPEDDAGTIAGERNVPDYISRDEFSCRETVDGKVKVHASEKYYGLVDEPGSRVAQSVAIWADGWPPTQQTPDLPIPAQRIVPADLSHWRYVPRNGEVAVDPVRGRIAFPPRQLPKRGVWVSYHYGFSADMGGGEYLRPISGPAGVEPIRVTGKDQLARALEPWRRPPAGGPSAPGADPAPPPQPMDAIIEITDSGVYVLPIYVYLQPGHTLQLRAAQRTRPVIKLLDWHANLPDNLTVTGGAGSRFTLDGIMVAGRGVQVEGELQTLTIRHSTLVPGWSLAPNCDPERPAEPSIELIDSNACVVIDHSIVGSIQVNDSQVRVDPVKIQVLDSIVDATGVDCESTECEAIGAAGPLHAHATLRVLRSTVIGRVQVHAIELAENSIFLSRMSVARRQAGCMRFCYVPPKSRTPRRFQCQPDLVEKALNAAMQGATADAAQIEAAREQERLRVRPRFNSIRYGTPTYCQLAADCAPEILRGADDEAEMGAFHDLFQPQRLANLQVRLGEFTPAASDVGIIFES